jgi:hypothetical protein
MPDQRGVARPQGAGCDAGAYEFAPPDVVTGPPSKLSTRSATATGTISPNARATTWFIQYGTTTAYGKRTATATLAAGTAADAVKAVLSGLKPHSLVHYRIAATNADGTRFGADATLRTGSFSGVTIGSRSPAASSRGRISLTLACPRGTSGPCKGTVMITTGRKRLGQASFTIAAGHRTTVRLKLTARARSLLRKAGRHGLAISITASARDASGSRATTKVSGRLKQ